MLHTVRIYLILYAVNDNVLSLTTIHNEHCVNVLSCLIGIQLPIQLTALAGTLLLNLECTPSGMPGRPALPSTPRTLCFPPFMSLTRRTLLSSGSLLLISSQGHIHDPSTCRLLGLLYIYCSSLQHCCQAGHYFSSQVRFTH